MPSALRRLMLGLTLSVTMVAAQATNPRVVPVVFEAMKAKGDGRFLSRHEEEALVKRHAPVLVRPARSDEKVSSVGVWAPRLLREGGEGILGVAVRIRVGNAEDIRTLTALVGRTKKKIFRSALFGALHACGTDSLPVFLEAIKHERREVRAAARWRIGVDFRWGLVVPPTEAELIRATTTLANALDDPNKRVRLVAANLLGWPALKHMRVMKKMLAALEDPEEEVRFWIAGAINRKKPRAALVGDALFECCASKGARARWAAGTTLRLHISFPEPKDIAVATRALAHENENVRAVAGEVLERLGSRAKDAVPALVQAMKTERTPATATTMALALAAVAPEHPAVLPALIAAVGRSSSGFSSGRRKIPAPGQAAATGAAMPLDPRVVTTLARLGRGREDAATALAKHVRKPNGTWGVAVIDALGVIGNAAAPNLPLMRQAMAADSLYVRIAAANAWGKIGGAPLEALPVAIEALRDRNPAYHSMVIPIIKAIGPHRPEVTPALRAALKSSAADVRQLAIGAIASMPLDRLRPLRSLVDHVMSDQDETVRKIATAAMKRLR